MIPSVLAPFRDGCPVGFNGCPVNLSSSHAGTRESRSGDPKDRREALWTRSVDGSDHTLDTKQEWTREAADVQLRLG